MPELPEVETVRQGLLPVMDGQVITSAQINRPDLRWPFPQNMSARLENARVLRLRRRSKYILVDLSSDETLLIHLGMSGRILISGAGGTDQPGAFHLNHPPVAKHDHVVFDLGSGARVTFNDPRRFGSMDLIETAHCDAHRLLADLGPEPLGNDFNDRYLSEAFHGKRSPVKSALLDQRIVAGLGNIYVCEALFRAKISPKRSAYRIGKDRIADLAQQIRVVLLEAIEAGGSSLRDYRQTSGDLGYFQHNFRVYGREGHPCVREDCSGTVARIVQSGRSSFYCPRCQR